MPKAKPIPKRTAAAAIAETLARGASSTLPPPPAAALAELRQIIAHNDAAAWGSRVAAAVAIELLQSYGWQGKGKRTLDVLCVKHFSRKSYAKA
jgi:hypothetical protein